MTKRVWITRKEESAIISGGGERFKSSENEKPTQVIEKYYTRWKHATLDSNLSLNDTTMPSKVFFAINYTTQILKYLSL